MFNKYYQEEMAFLRELGKEFAEAHPETAHLLSVKGSDPDVDRLLEGFAFLTGRVRQKLDDELPELTHMLMGLLWPHYLRPIPAMSILQFEPIPHILSDQQQVPRGTEVASVPVDEISCRFQTCYDVDLYPLSLADASIETPKGKNPYLSVRLEPHQGAQLEKLDLRRLRLFVHGEANVSSILFLWLARHVKQIVVRPAQGGAGKSLTLSSDRLVQVGFDRDQALLPYPRHAFEGYRFLQEYFTLPQKFMFFDLLGLEQIRGLGIQGPFEICFEFSERWDTSLRVSRENLLLYCTPVVNLFPHEADPIRVEHNRVSYRMRPHGADLKHYEIFSVDRVLGWDETAARQRVYEPFFSFKHGQASLDREDIFYHIRLHSAVVGQGTEVYISFVNNQDLSALPATEVISMELTCSNRTLPSQLRPGDINVPTDKSPEYAKFRNITTVTPSIAPPLGGELHWRLISHLSLNYQTLSQLESLRKVLGIYNFQALHDRQAARASELRLQGILKVETSPEERLFHGSPIRGTRIRLDFQEDRFAGEGDMILFATVLNEFFALYSTINSFSRLEVRGVQQGEIYPWPSRLGQQVII